MKPTASPTTAIAASLLSAQSCTITLREDQAVLAQQALEKLDFSSIQPASIALIGHDAELALSKTLDAFLTNIGRAKDPQLFALFDRLQDGIEDAKLPDLVKSIQSGKIGMLTRIRALFDKKAIANAAQSAYQSTCDMVSGRTNTLGGVIGTLEKELSTAMSTLLIELRHLELLQTTYRSRIDEFAISAALAQAFLAKSRAELEGRRKELEESQDPLARSELETLEHKLQLVQSRALALEGVYAKLPADRMVIQQIEAAGVQTLQETANTATARFSSIKTTLIALHGALQVKGLQRLNAKHADLDRQLGQVRAALTKEVVATAANAPGDNRIEQARQLQQIIALNGEIQSMVVAARAENKKKFEAAQQMFAAARLELTSLSGQAGA